MQPSRVVLALAAACLIVTPAVSGQPSLPDPCKLLTAAEVSAAIGIKSLPGRPFLGSHVSCIFAADTNLKIGAASVTVMVMSPVAYQNQRRLAGHSLSGVGDEAFYLSSGSYAKVGVLKGDRALSVTIVPGEASKATPAEVVDKEKGLAQKAVARL